MLHRLVDALLMSACVAANAADGEFGNCLAQVRTQALGSGITAQTFDAATTGLEPDESVLEAMRYQPEFVTPIWDYLAGLVDDQRVADGRARLEQWATVLAAAEAKFAVDRHTIVAVWGVESDYGRLMGKRPLVRSLATVACFGSRQSFFRSELIATLRIVQSGDFTSDALVGSWAGAFGQTQFMPSTFLRIAVDFDGDGRRDIVGSVPDALASTANYLKRAGWVMGEPSNRMIVASEASALTSQFHIIQPQVVKKNRRSPGFTSVCNRCSLRCCSKVPPAPCTMHFGTPVVPLE